MEPTAGLKLRAQDAEDLRVVAAVLQDALVPLGDIAFQKAQKRFVLVANRFMWEDEDDAQRIDNNLEIIQSSQSEGDAAFEAEGPMPRFRRVNCGVRFDGVRHVQIRNVDLRRRDEILNLLTIDIAPEALILVFSDGAAIRLIGKGIKCHLADLGEPWPTDRRPEHRLDDPDQPD